MIFYSYQLLRGGKLGGCSLLVRTFLLALLLVLDQVDVVLGHLLSSVDKGEDVLAVMSTESIPLPVETYNRPVLQDQIENFVRHISLHHNLVVALVVLGDRRTTSKLVGEQLGSLLEIHIYNNRYVF